jgi:hypothetical protein
MMIERNRLNPASPGKVLADRPEAGDPADL